MAVRFCKNFTVLNSTRAFIILIVKKAFVIFVPCFFCVIHLRNNLPNKIYQTTPMNIFEPNIVEKFPLSIKWILSVIRVIYAMRERERRKKKRRLTSNVDSNFRRVHSNTSLNDEGFSVCFLWFVASSNVQRKSTMIIN